VRSIRLDQQEPCTLVETELEGAKDVVAAKNENVGVCHEDFQGNSLSQDCEVDWAKSG
jgi:hypothetical protein